MRKTLSELEEEMKNWGRPIHGVHIIAMLDKLHKQFVAKENSTQ